MQPELKSFKLAGKQIPSPETFVKRNHTGFFCILDSNRVVSREQILISFHRAERLQSQSRIRLKESLFMMLVAGEPQISNAIVSAGIGPDTSEITVVYDNESDLMAFMQSTGGLLEPVDEPFPDETPENLVPHMFKKMIRVQLSL